MAGSPDIGCDFIFDRKWAYACDFEKGWDEDFASWRNPLADRWISQFGLDSINELGTTGFLPEIRFGFLCDVLVLVVMDDVRLGISARAH